MRSWTNNGSPRDVLDIWDIVAAPLPIVLVFLCLTSCRHEPRVEHFERSVGHLTQTELIRQFGYPQRLKQLKTSGEVWEYEFLAGESRCVGYRVFFDGDLLSRRWEPAACR